MGITVKGADPTQVSRVSAATVEIKDHWNDLQWLPMSRVVVQRMDDAVGGVAAGTCELVLRYGLGKMPFHYTINAQPPMHLGGRWV
ncbi:MAG TPA: hypothetical protein VM487_14805, partial [Phycisphaerae bacterium]|nr:hypothetical protein [Phycisphaerae bacterium]